MDRPVSGAEFLAELREKDGKRKPSFRDLSRLFEWKAREKGTPITGTFELTPLCNLNCKMCYVHLIPEQMGGYPVRSVSDWKRIMDQAFQAGMFQATLTGGECLAYPGFDELYLHLQSLGCEVCVMTNGVLLDENRIQFFKQHKPAKIQITLYGWNDDVYERVTGKRVFGVVSRNIRNAIETGLSVTISVTPNTYLGEDALETVRVAKALCRNVNINPIIFAPREETGRAGQTDDPDLDLYVRLYRLLDELEGQESREIPPEQLPAPGGSCHNCTEHGIECGAGRSCFTANWKGKIQPCNRLNMIQGDPLAEGFEEAWKRVNRWANDLPRVPECRGCAFEYICDNCAANIFLFSEPGKQPTELCKRTLYLVQHGVRHLPECD